MRLPLFNCFDYKKNFDLYKAFTKTNPYHSYYLMKEISDLDFVRYDKEISHQDINFDSVSKVTNKYMNLLPDLNKNENRLQSNIFAHYGFNMQFEFTYLLNFMDDFNNIEKIVSIEGKDILDKALNYNRPPIILPFHIGPAYAIPLIVSYFIKTAVTYNKMNFDEVIRLCCDNLYNSCNGININKGNVIKKILYFLNNNISLVMFPEYNPKGIGNHYVYVDFFGNKVKAPLGPTIISHLSKSPIVPVSINSDHNGKFNMKFCDCISPCLNERDIISSTDKVWKILQHELINTNYGNWEIWSDFNKIL